MITRMNTAMTTDGTDTAGQYGGQNGGLDMSHTGAQTGALLTLTQWLSPAFPIGAFAYSSGLEGAADMGWVTNAAQLEDWLSDALTHGLGAMDARVIAASYTAQSIDILKDIDDTCAAFAASAERLKETRDMGKTFARALAPWPQAQAAIPEGACLPVALGAAACAQKLPLDLTQTLYLQGWLTNLVAAGQRLAPVGQTDAQNILRRLSPLCADIAAQTADGDMALLATATLRADVASMAHETQYSRIFRT